MTAESNGLGGRRPPVQLYDESSLPTALATSSTDSLIFSTVGCTSRSKSCSTLESPSMRFVTSCNSLSIASWRVDNRCIHQKQRPQQPVPIQARTMLIVPRFAIIIGEHAIPKTD